MVNVSISSMPSVTIDEESPATTWNSTPSHIPGNAVSKMLRMLKNVGPTQGAKTLNLFEIIAGMVLQESIHVIFVTEQLARLSS